MALYVPPTEESDHKKQNMSLQLIGGATSTNTTNIAANTSDIAALQSSAILLNSAPTWTGFHTFTAGMLVNGSAHTGTFTGSGLSANFWVNQTSAASSASVAEIGAQFTLTSNVGTANKSTAYKIGLTSSVVGGANSASVYGANIITQGVAGSGGYLVTGIESDVNNVGADATTLGAATASYGLVSVAAGSFKSTAAYWATSVTVSWQYGFAISNTSGSAVTLAGFYDGSGSTNVLHSDTSHSIGVNFFSATFTNGLGTAFISPNNVGFGSANAAGNATVPLVYLDASNKAQHGSASVVGHVFSANPGSGNAAYALVNSHATANDIILQLQGGTATAVDTQTLYVNMVNPANTIQRGQINAHDAAGVGGVTYATTSDERLKKSLGPLTDALERLNKIEVHRYQGRQYDGDQYEVGFFAQNLHQAFPWAVTPSGHADYRLHPWLVDYGRITPLLVAALQQLIAKNEALEKRLTALE